MWRFVFALLFLIIPAQAFALAEPWIKDDALSIRLISGVEAVGNEAIIPLALDIDLKNGWHTYWRSPGQAGIPPTLDWSSSQTDDNNLQSATLLYPAPRRYTAYGLETVGYRDHVIFPIDVTLRKIGHALNASLALDLLVCSSICVPKHFDLQLNVPAGAANPGAEAPLLHQAHSQLPSDPDSAGILLTSISGDGQSLVFTISVRDPLSEPDIFIEDDNAIGFSAPIVETDPNGSTATLKVKPVDTLPSAMALAKLPLTLTIRNDDHATEIKAVTPASFSPSSTPVFPQTTPLLVAILFALIGGFILNLMPCVLPVLSLKILSVVGHGGNETNKVRQSFFVTAAGILFSFFVLACLMILLRHLGLALGWGVQFQQPAFLIFLIFILTFFASNMWGLLEIPLPRFLANSLDHPRLAGDFATGALATLLATPCSAPFLGTAVGVALASGPLQILFIFMALGFGMAFPYILIAVFPDTATSLPKPGIWMVRLRQFLGFILALTALWLIWVLAAQITPPYALIFGLLMAAVIVMLLLKKYGLPLIYALSMIVLLCATALALGLYGATKPKVALGTDRSWLAYDPIALNADIAEGKTVFLDITAEWCLTCKANMKFALSDDDVVEHLFHSDVVAMQANWTNPDPEISDVLHKYGRYGIPFNVVFGPSAPQGIVLPELLTPSEVLNALTKASVPHS